ncbi:MAG: VIT and VWA domain-containing protein [Aquabacterium sp.]|nr:VIT and VWA domain-containing protein [Aquabacterium sp.]
MSEDSPAFALRCSDSSAPAPVLVGVQAHGRLDAVMFELALRQTYRNTSDRVLEVVYTFPLPVSAVLLGFASELNGQRQQGQIVARRDAERRYEQSLAQGDAPVMLEAHRDGLHTANIGNLQPGDELVLECRYAQTIGFEQGRLRVSIPTTIAPRYGNAEQAGLQPQQVPHASLHADYPLALTLTLGPALAGASAECPTHRCTTRHDASGAMHMELRPGARLDRDVVVIVTPREPHPSLLLRAADTLDPAAPQVMLAALQPAAAPPRRGIALKLLVDCSGSMNGDSIASARAALRGVVAGLNEHDLLSLSRFGSVVDHVSAPAPVTAQSLRTLQPLIDGIQADLGGTEMKRALQAVLELPRGAEHNSADVLLITDGEIWQADAMVAAARSSGHRIFAIGVGSAPAEGVLRALAEASGGACEFATPGEALEAAARRMLHRMRQPVYTNVRIDWGCTPAWATNLPPSVFGGDTVIACAGLGAAALSGTVRLLAEDARGHVIELARSQADAPCPGDSLPRVAAARRIAQGTASDALELALRYQLMSEQTNCILAHQRDEADKATAPPELHRVSSMLAAGWGGLGEICAAQVGEPYRPAAASALADDFIIGESLDAFAVPMFSRNAAEPAQPHTLEELARCVQAHRAQGGRVQDLVQCERLRLHADLQRARDEVVALGVDRSHAWVLLAYWVNTRANGLADAALAAQLQPWMDGIDPALAAAAIRVYEQRLGGYPVDGWESVRERRLAQAMGRAMP